MVDVGIGERGVRAAFVQSGGHECAADEPFQQEKRVPFDHGSRACRERRGKLSVADDSRDLLDDILGNRDIAPPGWHVDRQRVVFLVDRGLHLQAGEDIQHSICLDRDTKHPLNAGERHRNGALLDWGGIRVVPGNDASIRTQVENEPDRPLGG